MDKYLTYIVLAILCIAAITITMYIKKRNANIKLVEKIKNQWGKNPMQFTKGRMNDNIAGYFENININNGSNESFFLIDNITWNDLDMDNVFKRLNCTLSTVGEQYLYYILRKPLMEDSELTERNRIIEFFQNNETYRLKVQFLLAKLGKVKFVDITNYLFNDYTDSGRKGFYYILLALGFLLSPFLMILNMQLGVLLTIGFFTTNMSIQYKRKYEIESNLEAFNYIVCLIMYGEKISNLQIPEISMYKNKLKDALKNLNKIVKKSFLVLYRSEDPFLEYFKVVLLGELIAYESMSKQISKYRKNLIEIFNIIGLIDSLISIASYRESVQYFTIPNLYKASDKKSHKSSGSLQIKPLNSPTVENANETGSASVNKTSIHFEDIYHPLLVKPVPNTFQANKPVLITGSNASGKSTFLKTIAINAIFAQTINTCLAKDYSSSYFMIYTSMALKDNLIDGESYYIVEIRSLKRIINNLNPSIPCLCIIDEVLRGTNTVERIAASSQVLHFLSQNNCLPFAATHDLELAQILKNFYDNYHFKEYITNNNIIFNYKIQPGESNTRNAIKLLSLMGYDDAIVNLSEKRAQAFITQGIWETM